MNLIESSDLRVRAGGQRNSAMSKGGISSGRWMSNALYLWMDISMKMSLRRTSISKKISTLWMRSYPSMPPPNSTFTQSIMKERIWPCNSELSFGINPKRRMGRYCRLLMAFFRSDEKSVSPYFHSMRSSYSFSSNTLSVYVSVLLRIRTSKRSP